MKPVFSFRKKAFPAMPKSKKALLDEEENVCYTLKRKKAAMKLA
jgi:hypothetical protein